MGYWNETCMLTRLPIRIDDACAAFLLQPNERPHHSRVEPDSFYTPILPAIHGSYDDYGGIKAIRASDQLLPELLKSKLLIKDSDQEFHPIQDYTDTLNCFEKVIRLAADTKLFTTNREPVHLVLVHEEFYHMAIKNAGRQMGIDPYKTDKAQLDCFNAYLRRMRRTWYPTTGSGSQTSIETQEDLDFYDLMYDRARDIYYSEHV